MPLALRLTWPIGGESRVAIGRYRVQRQTRQNFILVGVICRRDVIANAESATIPQFIVVDGHRIVIIIDWRLETNWVLNADWGLLHRPPFCLGRNIHIVRFRVPTRRLLWTRYTIRRRSGTAIFFPTGSRMVLLLLTKPVPVGGGSSECAGESRRGFWRRTFIRRPDGGGFVNWKTSTGCRHADTCWHLPHW